MLRYEKCPAGPVRSSEMYTASAKSILKSVRFRNPSGIAYCEFSAASGVLLAATNIPLWAKSKLLGGLFMASALASGSAAVTLQAGRRAVPDATLHRLAMIESVASAGEMAILTGYLVQSKKAARPLTTGRFAMPFWLGAVGAGMLLPLLLHRVAGRRHGRALRSLSSAAAICTIAGSLALRWSIFEAGKVSAEDQGASFDLGRG